jgi:hypothetical protein
MVFLVLESKAIWKMLLQKSNIVLGLEFLNYLEK